MAILRNAAECLKCGEVIESKHRHDFVCCKCGNLFVDGGRDYLRRGYQDGVESYVDHSVFDKAKEA